MLCTYNASYKTNNPDLWNRKTRYRWRALLFSVHFLIVSNVDFIALLLYSLTPWSISSLSLVSIAKAFCSIDPIEHPLGLNSSWLKRVCHPFIPVFYYSRIYCQMELRNIVPYDIRFLQWCTYCILYVRGTKHLCLDWIMSLQETGWCKISKISIFFWRQNGDILQIPTSNITSISQRFKSTNSICITEGKLNFTRNMSLQSADFLKFIEFFRSIA